MIRGVVSVVRKGRRAIADERFCAIPTIDGFTPSGGSFGTMVEINGKNFDPGANARLGNGSLRFTAPAKDQPSLRAQKITTTILPGDSDGRITVHNGCGPSAQSADIFNLVTGFRGNIHVTQGYDGLPLVTNKPTAIYSYLDATDWGPNDTVEVDAVRVRFRAPDGRESMVTRPYTPPKPMSGEEPKTPRSPTAGNARIPAEAIGVFNVYPTISGPVSVQTELMRRGYVVNRLPARTMYFHPNRDLTALFVPIMKEGYTAAELRAFKADIESRSYEASQRLMPQGQVRIVWSNEVMTSRDPIDAGDDISFVKSMFDVQRIRNAYNTNLFGTRADFGIGILHRNLTTVPQTADGVALGLGLTKFPTLEKIGAAASVALDSLCDSLVKAANTISFGLIGSRDGCNIEVPVGTSWVVGSSSVISKTLAHEIGHLLGLVAADAANGDANHNSSHSKNDEFFSVAGCKTYQAGPPHDVNLSRSIYTQLGASGPFINPIHGMIYPFPSLGSKPSDKHAKAIMSYACERNNDNSFFEPADVARLGFSVAPFFINAANAPRPAIPAAVPAAGPRLTVAGTINLESGEGDMPVVRPISELTPLSVSFVSNYQLVQLDAQGRELHRVGILPSLSVKDGGDHGADDALSNVAQFAANVQRHANVARIELRDGDRVLDTFVASRNAPTVRIVSSPSGMVTSDFVSIQWNASDPDGDSLEAMIEASHDQGITWKPVASGAGSGVARIPADVLDGGTWQLRVTATDGFNSSSVTSTSFSLAEQQPRVFIGELSSQESLEGRLVSFVGGVANEDRVAGNLVWSSDRDGWLGEGTSIETFLSVGRHRITLTALSQSGLPTSFTIEHVVVPDYDGDGITDDREFQLELHPLDGRDAFTDRDGDGLSEIGEILYGLNRNSVDTDGDGRSDGDEVRLGSNPWAADAAPTATMEVYPASLNLEADLALDIPLPQDQLMVVWNAPGTRTWNVSSDVPWLVTSSIDQVFEGTGMTPVHVLMQAFDLADGVHTGTITVRSSSPDAGTPVLVREVPVQVTVRNRLAYFDVNRDGTTDSADIQAIRAREGVDVSSPDYDYRLDVNRDGRITTADSALWDSASSRPTVADIDRLMAAIRANDGSFDLTGDGRINLDDLQYMVKIRARTFFGDANLDGRFDSADLVQVFQRGHYENRQSPIVGWGEGDWNADGRFDSSDLVAAFQDGGYLRSARHHALADWTELELDIDPRDGLLTL
jgi:hypothetical protein